MVLQLNLQSEGDRFTEHYGQNRVQMPLLLNSGRVPLSTVGIMKRRLEVRSPEFGKEYRSTSRESSIAQVAGAWWANYCDSGDGALYHPDGKIKIVAPIKEASFIPKDVRENVEFRSADEATKARFIIVDGKELLFMLSDDTEVHEAYDMGIWVKTPYFAQALNQMFELNWKNLKRI